MTRNIPTMGIKLASLQCVVSKPSVPVEKPWPVLIFFHGSGERGPEDGSKLWKVKIHGPWRAPGIERFAVIAPQCPTDLTWPGITDRVLRTARAAFKRYVLDTSRCCATGLSMGAFGAWAVACREPDMFQTVVPICGGFALPMASNISLRQLLPLARHDWTAHDLAPILKKNVFFMAPRTTLSLSKAPHTCTSALLEPGEDHRQ